MAWEDDELQEYETRRHRALRHGELAAQRNKLLEDRHNHEWQQLRAAVLERCRGINERGGRDILAPLTERFNALEIQREDGERLKASYDEKIKTATISSDALPYVERSYQLFVTSMSGNDSVTWRLVKPQRREPHLFSADEIAKEIVSAFLRAGIG